MKTTPNLRSHFSRIVERMKAKAIKFKQDSCKHNSDPSILTAAAHNEIQPAKVCTRCGFKALTSHEEFFAIFGVKFAVAKGIQRKVERKRARHRASDLRRSR